MSLRSTYTPSSGSGSTGYSSYSPMASYCGMPDADEMRSTDLIAEYLVKERAPYILGHAGHGAISLLDGIVKVKEQIRHICRASTRRQASWPTSTTG